MRAVVALGFVCVMLVGCAKESKVEIPSAPVKIDTSKIVVAGVGGDSTPPKTADNKADNKTGK